VKNPANDAIEANSDSVLRVEILSLGYTLYVTLRYFAWKTEKEGDYRVQVRFQPLEPQDDSEMKIWSENRRRAYLGSFRHFLKCFFECRWVQENFVVFYGKATDYHGAWRGSRLIQQNITKIFWNASTADFSYKTFANPAFYSVFYMGTTLNPSLFSMKQKVSLIFKP
jgi:hypothetical protein